MREAIVRADVTRLDIDRSSHSEHDSRLAAIRIPGFFVLFDKFDQRYQESLELMLGGAAALLEDKAKSPPKTKAQTVRARKTR